MEFLKSISIIEYIIIGLILLILGALAFDVDYIKENGCTKTGNTKLTNTLIPVVSTNGVTTLVPTVVVKHEMFCSKTQEIIWR